jgi:CspA family cold shock protein
MRNQEQMNLTGSVKVYFEEKGFGFIQNDDLGDVFFHVKNLDPSYEEVNQGDEVSFNAVPSRKKADSYEALAVNLI